MNLNYVVFVLIEFANEEENVASSTIRQQEETNGDS